MRLLLLVFTLFLSPLLGEQTLAMIKPDAVKKQHVGEIIHLYEKSGLRIAALKMTKLTPEQVQLFYWMLKEKPFFPELSAFMTSGPVVVMVLEGDHAIMKNRQIMGPTDPKEAAPDTIRARFGRDKGQNAIHGSDSPLSAIEEIQFFFKPNEIY